MSDLPRLVEQAIERALPHAEMDADHMREVSEGRLKIWRERISKIDGDRWARREAAMYYLRMCIIAAALADDDGDSIADRVEGRDRTDSADDIMSAHQQRLCL